MFFTPWFPCVHFRLARRCVHGWFAGMIYVHPENTLYLWSSSQGELGPYYFAELEQMRQRDEISDDHYVRLADSKDWEDFSNVKLVYPAEQFPADQPIYPRLTWLCWAPVVFCSMVCLYSCETKRATHEVKTAAYEARRKQHYDYLNSVSPLVYITATGETYHTYSHYPHQSAAEHLYVAQQYLQPCLNCRPPSPQEFPQFIEDRPLKESAWKEQLLFFLSVAASVILWQKSARTDVSLNGFGKLQETPEKL